MSWTTQQEGRIERSITQRHLHMWCIAIFVTGLLVSTILVAGGMIADSLDAYCPEDTGVVFRLT